ncbi:hypothetical protein JD844_015324, partial [Phrynosoma platyrhinos]
MQNALSASEEGRKSPDGLVFERRPTAPFRSSKLPAPLPGLIFLAGPQQDDQGRWLSAPLLLLGWPPLNCVDFAPGPPFYLVPPKKSPCHWENCLAGFLKSASLGSVREEVWMLQLLSGTRPQSVAGCPFQLSSQLLRISYPPALLGEGETALCKHHGAVSGGHGKRFGASGIGVGQDGA